MHFNNPLRLHRIPDFSDVHEPIPEAPIHSSPVEAQDSGMLVMEHLSHGHADVESRHADTKALLALRNAILDPETTEGSSLYNREAKIVNHAINNIGKGPFQRSLWLFCGLGWFADNLWLQGIALTLPQVSTEFGQSESNTRYATMSLFAGLCVGASLWGIASDKIGRRPAFNCTLFIAGLFGLLSGFAESFEAVCALYACVGVGVGGNLPVDGAFLLEFLPADAGHWLTLLSVCWPIGQLVASGVAWGFNSKFSCSSQLPLCSFSQDHGPCCPKDQNAGWRYPLFALGSLTLVLSASRSYFHGRIESPKYLLSRGKRPEAVAMVYRIAYYNRRKTWLSLETMDDLLSYYPSSDATEGNANPRSRRPIPSPLSRFSTEQVRPLFSSGKLALSTTLIWFMWLTIGMGYPLFNSFLPQYLANNGPGGAAPTSPDSVYRNYFITSAVGVPGSILACQTVKIRGVGRKYTMAFATVAAGMLLIGFGFTQDQASQIAVASVEAFFQNIAYGVMYAYTPEVFPAPNRGTGSGISSFLNRLGGFCAPLIAIHVGQVNPSAPIYAAGGLFMITFVAMCALPIETRGRETL